MIEVAANANPPVCRVMDYGKYKYEQGKKERDAKKKQKQSELKTIRMRPDIDEHDWQFKYRNTVKFLRNGNKVKVNVIFRSREFSHPEFARNALLRMAEGVKEENVGVMEKAPAMEGRMMVMMLAPIDEK